MSAHPHTMGVPEPRTTIHRTVLLVAILLTLTACGEQEPVATEGASVASEGSPAEPAPSAEASVDDGVLAIGDSRIAGTREALAEATRHHLNYATSSGSNVHPEAGCFLSVLNDVLLDSIFCGPSLHYGAGTQAHWDVTDLYMTPDRMASGDTLSWSASAGSEFTPSVELPDGVQLLELDRSPAPVGDLTAPLPPAVAKGTVLEVSSLDSASMQRRDDAMLIGPFGSLSVTASGTASTIRSGESDLSAAPDEEFVVVTLFLASVESNLFQATPEARGTLIVDDLRSSIDQWGDLERTGEITLAISAPSTAQVWLGVTSEGREQRLDVRTGERESDLERITYYADYSTELGVNEQFVYRQPLGIDWSAAPEALVELQVQRVELRSYHPSLGWAPVGRSWLQIDWFGEVDDDPDYVGYACTVSLDSWQANPTVLLDDGTTTDDFASVIDDYTASSSVVEVPDTLRSGSIRFTPTLDFEANAPCRFKDPRRVQAQAQHAGFTFDGSEVPQWR